MAAKIVARARFLFARTIAALACSAGLAVLWGCAPGAAVVGLLVADVADGGGGSAADRPATVVLLGAPAGENPEQIEVRFQIDNDDGEVDVRLEYEVITPLGGDLATGTTHTATSYPGFELPRSIPPGVPVTFLWDAAADLGESSAFVVLRAIVREEGVAGERTLPLGGEFRAGNTGPRLSEIHASNERQELVLRFSIVDAESDLIIAGGEPEEDLIVVTASIDGDPPVEIPSSVIPRTVFASAPQTPSEQSFRVDLRDERIPPALSRAGTFGFVGEMTVTLSIRDFPSEPFSPEKSASFDFDNNDAPFVEFLPPEPGDLESGVVPIRYRVFNEDEEAGPVSLRVQVDLGSGPEPAIEFPLPQSDGTLLCAEPGREDCALQPSQAGIADGPFRTFFWNALSHQGVGRSFLVSIEAEDAERGAATERLFSGLDVTRFLRTDVALVGDKPEAIAVGDFDGDGVLDLALANALSDSVTYLRGGRDGFAESRRREIDVGDRAVALQTGDFDGDRVLDLVVANERSGTVTYLRGGAGGLTESESHVVSVGEFPVALAAGDFNGDDQLDIAVANQRSGNVTCLLGGPGGLTDERRSDTPVGDAPAALESGDFDGDGVLDLAVANEVSATVTYLRGREDGLARHATEISVGDVPAALESGDFNGDGALDLAVANSGSAAVTYLSGGPDGLTDAGAREIPVGEYPVALAPGDFDGDGVSDLAVANSGSGTITYLRGGPEGLTELSRIDVAVGDHPVALDAGDLDGDGALDLVVANAGFFGTGGPVTYLRGGRGGLNSERQLEIGVGDLPFAVRTGDFDADGALDLVVASDRSVTHVRGRPGGLVEERRVNISVGATPVTLEKGDFDGDGALDLAVANRDSDTVTYLRGGAGGLTAERRTEIRVGDRPFDLEAGDFDGDGALDLAVIDSRSDTLVYLRGGPEGLSRGEEEQNVVGVQNLSVTMRAGRFDADEILDLAIVSTLPSVLTVIPGGADFPQREQTMIALAGLGSCELEPGDFDGDGSLDLAIANRDSGTVTLVRRGDGGFSDAILQEMPVGRGPCALEAGDFDSDGLLDIAVANAESSTVSILRGGVDGFSVAATLSVGSSPVALASGDYDGDGSLDLAVANEASSSVTFLWSRKASIGDRTRGDVSVGDLPVALESGDFDGDGRLDLVVLNRGSDSVTYLRGGPGGPTDERRSEMAVGLDPLVLEAGDFDGDGALDLAVANEFSNTVTQLRSRYLIRHASCLVWPEDANAEPGDLASPALCELLDTGTFPRYRLELPSAAFSASGSRRDSLRQPTPVVVVPTTVFPFPSEILKDTFRRNEFLAIVADPVAILRESLEIQGEAVLTLRLRDRDLDLFEEVRASPDRLRVFWRRGEDGEVEELGEVPELVSFRDGSTGHDAVAFRVTRFGRYLVAFERERTGE